MNFLAHIYLAGDNDDHVVGQVLADYLERGWQERASDGVVRGVRIHQQIDRYTDRHEVFRRSRERLPAGLRRYAGIVVDIFYDHLLARNWERFLDVPLEEFARSRYRVLESRSDEVTDRMRRAVASMIQHDWLTSYQHLAGIDRTLMGVSRRLSRANPIGEAGAILAEEADAFEADFLEFFPDLETFALGLAAEPRSGAGAQTR